MADYSYPDTQLFLNGEWKPAAAGETIAVTDPATGEVIGQVAKAGIVDLDTALAATQAGFATWSATSAYDRARIMRKAADILRERKDRIAWIMTREQGKPIAESTGEVAAAADLIAAYTHHHDHDHDGHHHHDHHHHHHRHEH